MALSDLRFLDPDLWRKYKEGLPASITEGPTDAFGAIMAEKDSAGRRAFLGAMDTMDALQGKPAGSREGVTSPESRGDTALRVLGDAAAITGGGVPPTMSERGTYADPGLYEQIITPGADLMSIARRGGLASGEAEAMRDETELDEREMGRGSQQGGRLFGGEPLESIVEEPGLYEKIMGYPADIMALRSGRLYTPGAEADRDVLRLREQRLAMNQRKADFDMITGYFTMHHKIVDEARKLPPEQQEEKLLAAANYMDARGMDSVLMRQEAAFPGTVADDAGHLFDLFPEFEALHGVFGMDAVEEVAKKPEMVAEMTRRMDTQALGPMTQIWNEAWEPWLLENEPEMMERINKDNLTSIDEVGEMLMHIPESMLPRDKLEYVKAFAVRNSDTLEWIDTKAVTEKADIKRAELGAEQPFKESFEKFKAGLEKKGADKTGINLLIPGLEGPGTSPIRLSFDGGRTFMDKGVLRSVDEFPGTRKVGMSVQASGVEGLEKKLDVKRAAEASERASEIAAQVAQGEELMRKVNRAGWRAVGPIGAISMKVGGFIGGFNPPAGEDLTKWMSGISQEEIASLNVAAKSFAVQTIEVATGEEGARKTEYEQRLGDQVSKVKDPYTSFAQVRGAIGGVMGVWLTNLDKANIDAGTVLEHDLETVGGRLALMSELDDMGLSAMQVSDTVHLMQAQRKWLVKSGATLNYGEPGG